jgi:hypothetical protein
VSTIIDLLTIANDITDREARHLIHAAALRLAQAQWRSEAPRPAVLRRAPQPAILPIRTPGRAGGASKNGNRHA